MNTYGLVGYPLGHSFSKGYFTDFFALHGFDAVYENFELASIDQLPAMLASVPALCGFNVTIPYKQQVIDYLDELDAAARAIGAVNVVKVMRLDGATHLTTRVPLSWAQVGPPRLWPMRSANWGFPFVSSRALLAMESSPTISSRLR